MRVSRYSFVRRPPISSGKTRFQRCRVRRGSSRRMDAHRQPLGDQLGAADVFFPGHGVSSAQQRAFNADANFFGPFTDGGPPTLLFGASQSRFHLSRERAGGDEFLFKWCGDPVQLHGARPGVALRSVIASRTNSGLFNHRFLRRDRLFSRSVNGRRESRRCGRQAR